MLLQRGIRLAQAGYLVEHTLGDLPLGGFRHFDHFTLGDDGNCVPVGVEANAFPRDIIDHDSIERFGHQLLARIFQHIFGFSGKAYDDLRSLGTSQFRKNVGGGLQLPS